MQPVQLTLLARMCAHAQRRGALLHKACECQGRAQAAAAPTGLEDQGIDCSCRSPAINKHEEAAYGVGSRLTVREGPQSESGDGGHSTLKK